LKPRPIQPCPNKEAGALSGEENTIDITQPAPSSKNTIQRDDPKTPPPEIGISSIAINTNRQPTYALERFILDDVPLIQGDGDLDGLDQSNDLLDVGEFLDASLLPDPDNMASLDMVDSSSARLISSDYSGIDLLRTSLPPNGLKPDLEFTCIAKSGPNRIMTGNSGWLDESMPSRFAPEVQVAENKGLIPFLQTGTTTLDISYNHKNHTYLADPYQNAILFSQVTILNICAQNANCLGMAPEDFISDNCLSLCSPFYRPVSASDDPVTLLAAVSKPFTPTFLQPTLSQILFPHHPIFDLIPIPGFRERAIMLATTSPALLNSLELKQDIMCGGLVCWGTKHGSNHGGKGQPWDLRSWEAAPWFLKKWRLLVGGKDGDLWKQSMWWRNLRGETMTSD
jgi:hypothetical protein